MFKGGIGGWIEHKKTETNTIKFQPLQIGWLSRRARLGGRCFVAIRFKKDFLYLYHGGQAASLQDTGLCTAGSLGVWNGGVAKWDWDEIRKILTQT